jgi:glutamine synthetase
VPCSGSVTVSTTAGNRQQFCPGIQETRQLFRQRHATVAEHVQSVLTAIRETDEDLGAFVAVAGAGALREAEAADRLIAERGSAAFHDRPLLGATVAVKDLIQTQDLPTRRGSLLPNRRPAADAPVVTRLRSAGAIVVGKTATSEYGWSASTVSRVAGPTRNPWAPDRSAGGSSGGSAAAVAAGLCTVSVGTDGAGSVRIPAAFCGVVGFKPSFGRIPYVPLCAERLSHLGPLARNVADIAELMSVLAGPDHRDPDSVTAPPTLTTTSGALRIGWIEFPGTSAEIRRVTEGVLPVLTGLGHRVDRIDVPFPDPYGALVDILAATEAAGTAPEDDERCDAGRAAIVRYGRTLSGAAVMRAEEVRLSLRARLGSVMDDYDLLAMATVPTEPFAADAIAPPWAADPDDLLWLAWSPATYPFNITGQPALSLPVGRTFRGLPVGLQLVGRVGADALVLAVAGRIEAELAAMTPRRPTDRREMIMMSRPWSLGGDSGVGRPSFVAEFGLWDDRQAAAAEQVEVELDKVDLVRVVFGDPHGLARSKTMPANVFRTVLRNGMDFSAGPFLFDTGHAVAVDFLTDPGVGVGELLGAGDFVLVPDPRTFQVLPGTEPRTAWVLGNEFLRDGSPHPLASREVLRRVCAQYAKHDLAPVIGLEIEWYLTRLAGGPPGNAGNGFGAQGPAPVVEAMNPGYQFNLDGYYDSVAEVADPLAAMLMALGLPLRTIEHESGPGQLETTFGPMLALDAADAMLLLRTQIKQYCRRRGYHASFMTLPRLESFDPSGWHLHQSVLSTKTNTNVFAAGGSALDTISPEGEAYIAGLLSHARELCLLSVPTVNGYRRLAPEFTLSPTSVDWRFEDRSVLVRVLSGDSSTHVENRIGEPCANPYLSIAAQLYAGLAGLSSGPPANRGDHPALPRSLREALDAFRGSSRAEDLLGTPLKTCLTKLKESEAARFDAWCAAEQPPADQVTEWEHREYFGVF